MAATICASRESSSGWAAPGAGKGTNTPFIAETRGITAPPIVISGLLTSPQAVAIKNAGKMVGDREVIGLLFDELLSPQYHEGVIIDGFPRTMVQVECLKMFYHAMLDLHVRDLAWRAQNRRLASNRSRRGRRCARRRASSR